MVCLSIILVLAACQAKITQESPIIISPTPSGTSALILPTLNQITPTATPTHTLTPGPSPTSTPLPPITAHQWLAEPIMIEAALVSADALDLFGYTPVFILYGDGMLVKRVCEQDECRNLTTQLDQDALCQLLNAIDRTGFLQVDPTAYRLPAESGTQFRLSVNIYSQNTAEIPDLERWINNPEWYAEIAGCDNCFDPPSIDPAFITLYQLLTSYPTAGLSGLNSDRLALWISDPVIAATPRLWDERLISLTELEERSLCPDKFYQRQAVILEGSQAQAVANFISQAGLSLPIFRDGEHAWQVQSRWLAPYEMPNTCQGTAGLYPPETFNPIQWRCDPAMGAIPTATATITPTPSITPTPLR